MKKIAFAIAETLPLSITAGSANVQSRPGGCLNNRLGGAVAGHSQAGTGSREPWQAVILASINAESTSARSGSRTKSATGFPSADL
jgi:hypothetical protein